MSEPDSTQTKTSAYEKGDRAAIVRGRNGVGGRGSIFWVGENKYGPGMRYGLRGDDGATYWVDEADLGPEEQAPSAPNKPKSEPPELEKGDVAVVTGGPHEGHRGEVFWVGRSRYDEGWRYGIRGEGEEAVWVDGPHVRKKQQGHAVTNDSPTAGQAPVYDELPPEAHELTDDLPPEAYEDHGAGDDGDLPF